MHRREALITLGVGATGYLGTAAFTAPGCPVYNGKNLSTQILIITESYNELLPLLPELGLGQPVIDRVSKLVADAIKVAKQFDKAYQAGAFENAAALFKNLSSLVSNIATELNVAQDRIVRGIIAGVGIARIIIAALIQAQADQLPAATLDRARTGSQTMAEAMAEIKRLNLIPIPALQ